MTKLRTAEDIIEANQAMYDQIGKEIPVPVARERNRLIRNQLTALDQLEMRVSGGASNGVDVKRVNRAVAMQAAQHE